MSRRKTRGKGSVRKVRGVMNATEAAYADFLDILKQKGEVLQWDYEPESLKLAKACYYVPDFRVVWADSYISMEEVKGGYIHEKSWVKLKVAASIHPYTFYLVIIKKGKVISRTEVGESTREPECIKKDGVEEDVA